MNAKLLITSVVKYAIVIPGVFIISIMVVCWEQLYGGGPGALFSQALVLLMLLAFIYEEGFKNIKLKEKNTKLFYIAYVMPGTFAVVGFSYNIFFIENQ